RNRLARGLAPGSSDQPCAVRHGLACDSDEPALLACIEESGLARRSRDDDAVDAGSQKTGDVLAERLRRDLTGGRLEGRRNRREDPLRNLAIRHFGNMLDKSSVKPADLLSGSAGAGWAAGATRERRRSVRTCSWKSEGFDEAASAVSYVTMSSATRSIRC